MKNKNENSLLTKKDIDKGLPGPTSFLHRQLRTLSV